MRRRTVSPIRQKFALLNSKENFRDLESARFQRLSPTIGRFFEAQQVVGRNASVKKRPSPSIRPGIFWSNRADMARRVGSSPASSSRRRSPHIHAAPRGQARDAALRRPPTGGGGQHHEGLPDRFVEAGGADLLEIDRVPLAQEREFFADGLSGGPIVAECLDPRLGCPPNRRAVCLMMEMADA